MWKVWRRILLLGTYIWSVGKWRIWVMPTLCGFSRTCQSRKIATYHVKMVEPHFTPCRHYIFMQMFKLYYNLWPITFVFQEAQLGHNFFSNFFDIPKLRKKISGQNIEITTSFVWWDIVIHNANSPNPHDLNGKYKIHIISNLSLGNWTLISKVLPIPYGGIGIWTHETREFCTPHT